MADTSPGFRPRYRLNGGQFTIQNLISADTALAKGDLVNLESGQADLAVTTDANLIGVVLETKAGMTGGTTRIKCIVDADAVYGVYDANARAIGATLDIAGATGAQTVAASSGKEFVVVADSTATEETLVKINADAHFNHKTQ
jgi:hypothetical protein